MADIKGYLKTINEGKSGETVRDAIVNCMRDINEDGAVKKASLVITKPDNVTYKPGKGKAFSSVTVNITGGESDPNKTIHYETLNVTELTENGTYPKEEQPDTYYDKVVVDIDWDSVQHPSNLGEEADMINYETDESGNKYWDASFAGYDYVKRIWIPNSVAAGLPGGDYPGAGGAGPFKVDFYDRPKSAGSPHLIKSVTVERGGDAAVLYNSDNKPLPSYGGTFAGWDPPVNAVYSSMKTYARYTSSPMSGDPTQITDSWEQIVADSDHSKYLGKFAFLEVKDYNTEGMILLPENQLYRSKVATQNNPDPTHPTDFHYMTLNNPSTKFMIKMQCVALGESGSKSTWLAMNPLPSRWVMDNDSAIIEPGVVKDYYGSDDWNSSYMHQFFEKCLIAGIPEVVKTHIKEVTKWSWGVAQYSPIVGDNSFVVKSSGCKLWIPSVGEIDSKFTDFSDDGYVEKRDPEASSINYGAIWLPDGYPNTPISIATRSVVRLNWTYGLLGVYNCNTNPQDGTFTAGSVNFNESGNVYLGFCLA